MFTSTKSSDLITLNFEVGLLDGVRSDLYRLPNLLKKVANFPSVSCTELDNANERLTHIPK